LGFKDETTEATIVHGTVDAWFVETLGMVLKLGVPPHTINYRMEKLLIH